MTRREEIFSKEFITTGELAELLGLDKCTASTVLNNIKRVTDRLGIKGKIHVQDYIDYYHLPQERYSIKSN